MNLLPIAIAAVALATAGAASAGARATDADYLKAQRCKGLADGLGGTVDTAALDAFLKTEGRSRQAFVIDRGATEMTRAKREAKSEDRKARLTAELTGPCLAYLGAATDVAKR